MVFSPVTNFFLSHHQTETLPSQEWLWSLHLNQGSYEKEVSTIAIWPGWGAQRRSVWCKLRQNLGSGQKTMASNCLTPTLSLSPWPLSPEWPWEVTSRQQPTSLLSVPEDILPALQDSPHDASYRKSSWVSSFPLRLHSSTLVTAMTGHLVHCLVLEFAQGRVR